jgi:dethiobiotin synthetase
VRGVFVTGTDTGVGKTLVSCAIAAALRERGGRVGVYKPVETGCRWRDGRLVGEDVERLCAAAGGIQRASTAASFLFEMPAAPLVAAQAAGASIDPDRLVEDAARVINAHAFTLVEGAGGLRVPIARGYTFLELACALAIPAVVIVGSKLGCINHALLTLDALDSAGVTCAGFVVNHIGVASDPGLESNLEAIRGFTHTPCLGAFPSVPSRLRDDPVELAKLANTHLELSRLVP